MTRLIEEGPLPACACPDCTCRNFGDIITNSGRPMCGCCMADCPDVHGRDGARGRSWRSWREVRNEASASGALNEERIEQFQAQAKKALEEYRDAETEE